MDIVAVCLVGEAGARGRGRGGICIYTKYGGRAARSEALPERKVKTDRKRAGRRVENAELAERGSFLWQREVRMAAEEAMAKGREVERGLGR